MKGVFDSNALMSEQEQVRTSTGSPLHTDTLVVCGSNRAAFTQDAEPLDAEAAMTALYSIFTRREKRFIVFMVAWAGLFAPLSAAIYFPVLPTLARDMHVSNALINLTVTSFMLFQALTPTIFGDLADEQGRRPVYMLTFAIYLVANIGLAKQNSFVALLLLRCLQSAGSSGTAVLGNSIVADIATSGDRGTYMGLAYAGALLGPTIGPAIGGIISQFLGWRAIFWFLTVLCGLFTVLFLICFPETGRNIVGNGSVPPPGWDMSLLNYLQVRKFKKDAQLNPAASRREQFRAKVDTEGRQFRWPNPLKTIYILMEKDAVIILLYNGLIYTSFYCVTTSAPPILKRIYGFNDLQIGLCYMNKSYKSVAKSAGIVIDRNRGDDMRNFPIEEARLSVVFPIISVGICILSCYGWTLHMGMPLAVPLLLQGVIGLTFTGIFMILSTLLLDLFPHSTATATAANNLVRCLLSATGIGVIELLISSMGLGWCFSSIAMAIAITSPFLWVELKFGPRWREARYVRDEEKTRAKNPVPDDALAARIIIPGTQWAVATVATAAAAAANPERENEGVLQAEGDAQGREGMMS
ncbi:hypothetical protein GP486_006251 [Trichoglossum hirsutum]|uniref:Major facilitator superfamily (MFS) profile domain-containing protein n=1 Tax=Trichoglossum hirsutum TaxID=265104 RepID=A0A9P8IK89_9PEZI|nr:hypothetical protein GP486_006251 [Trichoglossum hirsutum]